MLEKKQPEIINTFEDAESDREDEDLLRIGSNK